MTSKYSCDWPVPSNYSCDWPVARNNSCDWPAASNYSGDWPVASNYNCGWPVTSKYSYDWPVASQVVSLMTISQPPGLMSPNALITDPGPVSGPAKCHKRTHTGLTNVSKWPLDTCYYLHQVLKRDLAGSHLYIMSSMIHNTSYPQHLFRIRLYRSNMTTVFYTNRSKLYKKLCKFYLNVFLIWHHYIWLKTHQPFPSIAIETNQLRVYKLHN